MKRLFSVTLLVAVFFSMSFTHDRPPEPAKYPMAITKCGFNTLYDGAVWAGHTEFWLQQQGYGNFYVASWCGGDDFCSTLCFRVYYDPIPPSLSPGKTEVHYYQLKTDPGEKATEDQLRKISSAIKQE